MKADFLSRFIADNHDYCLNNLIFDDLWNFLKVEPEVDLFGSRITRKLNRYVTKYYDPVTRYDKLRNRILFLSSGKDLYMCSPL